MSDQNNRKEKLKIIFATYPQEDTVYMTSDEKAFFNEEQANAHAQRLKDDTVSKYPKKFWEKAIDILNGNQETGDEIQDADPEDQEQGDKNQEKANREDAAQEEAAEEVKYPESAPVTSEDERAVLAARFEELAGRKPASNMKIENLRKAVADLESNH